MTVEWLYPAWLKRNAEIIAQYHILQLESEQNEEQRLLKRKLNEARAHGKNRKKWPPPLAGQITLVEKGISSRKNAIVAWRTLSLGTLHPDEMYELVWSLIWVWFGKHTSSQGIIYGLPVLWALIKEEVQLPGSFWEAVARSFQRWAREVTENKDDPNLKADQEALDAWWSTGLGRYFYRLLFAMIPGLQRLPGVSFERYVVSPNLADALWTQSPLTIKHPDGEIGEWTPNYKASELLVMRQSIANITIIKWPALENVEGLLWGGDSLGIDEGLMLRLFGEWGLPPAFYPHVPQLPRLSIWLQIYGQQEEEVGGEERRGAFRVLLKKDGPERIEEAQREDFVAWFEAGDRGILYSGDLTVAWSEVQAGTFTEISRVRKVPPLYPQRGWWRWLWPGASRQEELPPSEVTWQEMGSQIQIESRGFADNAIPPNAVDFLVRSLQSQSMIGYFTYLMNEKAQPVYARRAEPEEAPERRGPAANFTLTEAKTEVIGDWSDIVALEASVARNEGLGWAYRIAIPRNRKRNRRIVPDTPFFDAGHLCAEEIPLGLPFDDYLVGWHQCLKEKVDNPRLDPRTVSERLLCSWYWHWPTEPKPYWRSDRDSRADRTTFENRLTELCASDRHMHNVSEYEMGPEDAPLWKPKHRYLKTLRRRRS